MLSACSFWFTRLTLIQALTLWRLPDGENQPGQPVPDDKKLVADWAGMDGRWRRDQHHEHPFTAGDFDPGSKCTTGCCHRL